MNIATLEITIIHAFLSQKPSIKQSPHDHVYELPHGNRFPGVQPEGASDPDRGLYGSWNPKVAFTLSPILQLLIPIPQ